MKVISLISSGIDSPVATSLALKKGYDVIALHMDNRPFTDKRTIEKVKSLVMLLEKAADRKIKLYIAPHGPNLAEFARACKINIECILCKRMMLRIAEHVASMEDAKAIITGESLGQVASQTLQNLRVEEESVIIPIIRPLIGLDKVEIIEIAKRIGTYSISISPVLCCTAVPARPATCALLESVLVEEKKIDTEKLVRGTLETMITVYD